MWPKYIPFSINSEKFPFFKFPFEIEWCTYDSEVWSMIEKKEMIYVVRLYIAMVEIY